MNERKYTDEEVIKALECCIRGGLACCECCYYIDEAAYHRGERCAPKLKRDALDLINRQKAEIKKVKSCLEFYLDNNEEMGVVFIPKFVVEKRIKEMTEGENGIPKES